VFTSTTAASVDQRLLQVE